MFDLDAGVDSLAFVNTLDNRGEESPVELLTDYADLLAFALQTETLTESEARRLRELASARPSDAALVVSRATALRETLFRIFSAIAAEVDPASEDIKSLNAELSIAMSNAQIIPAADQFDLDWSDDPGLDRPLWPVVRSAADLLTSDELTRVRECAAHDCQWLFLDESRNRSRRWCNMQTCGNRAKVDRFRARQRGAEIVDGD